jgi:PadR family transcriptional regulator
MDLMKGTLDMLILRALSTGPMHGYAVARWIEGRAGDLLRVEEGSLYPALHRMARRGWIRSDWGRSENRRRARFYELTDRGRERLDGEASRWADFVRVVESVME